MKPLLLIKTGGTIPEIIPGHGDFEDWFADGLGNIEMMRVDVHKGQKLPEPQSVSAIVITGSASMVSDREDWSEYTCAWLRRALKREVTILGVCYGHQLLAHALGGEVGPNPRGREIGTRRLTFGPGAKTDELFHPDAAGIDVQTTHMETVLTLPEGAERLGWTRLDQNAVVRFSRNAWGVQHHPEFPAEVMREYIRIRAGLIREEGQDPQALLETTRETPEARSLLGRFVARVRRKAA